MRKPAITALLLAIVLTITELPLNVFGASNFSTLPTYAQTSVANKASPDALIYASADMVSADSNYSNYENYEKALDLKILGLLAGTGGNFDLGRVPTRVEGAVMLVRLLGKEKEAMKANYSHPFKDVPSWANSYVGYMWHNSLTSGVGNNSFGTGNPLTAQQYVVFVLRALGYDDRKGDFEFAKALDKAVQIGLINSTKAVLLKKSAAFTRDALAGLSHNALSTRLKSSDQTLLDRLVNVDKAVNRTAAAALGLYTSDLLKEFGSLDDYGTNETTYGFKVKNSEALFRVMRTAFYLHKSSVKLDITNYSGSVSDDFSKACYRAFDTLFESIGVKDLVKSWNCHSGSSSMTVTISYRYSLSEYESKKNQAKESLFKARHIVGTFINSDMQDYDKEKLLHDYLVNNARYDYENYNKGTISDESNSTYGCLILGITACKGYAEAMKLLCDLSWLECKVVVGDSSDSNGAWIGHAWNIVKINGAYYHLDVTFDDPVVDNAGNMLTYFYFNLTDSDMKKIDRWKASDYPVCTSTIDSYYIRNNLVAVSMDDFTTKVRKAINLRKSQLEIKIKDFSAAKFSDYTDAFLNSGSVSGVKCITDDNLGIIHFYDVKYF